MMEALNVKGKEKSTGALPCQVLGPKDRLGREKVRLCFQGMVTKSFSLYPPSFPLFITALQEY